ncbi:MAG TPA: F0F1 ATP synthase subunit alpha [Anaerolineales bacterium]|jgi:F-type H+-transporting ATPase subunit alpha|nr:F0F1 ATP synthase subunit alpha [Anaerolineales bacterium]
MSDFIKDISTSLQKQIDDYQPDLTLSDIGTVFQAGDGIALAHGLKDVQSQELVQFENGVMGIAFNLEADNVGIIIMGEFSEIEEGMTVRSTGRIASVPVGPAVVGRVVNALGLPIDGKGPIQSTGYRPIERIAPGVIERKDVDTPVQTGIKAIDALTPIGRGQRELIIGDRQTGKTALAIDTIINQKDQDLICIYVAIGQKKAAIARTVAILEEHGAMDNTVVVVAAADEPAALQYIAPYAGCTIGEEFMENGQDALIIYDDLSKHAWAYRQVSLLLRRPPGREAYPGDVFYLHSRLLERAARLADNFVVTKKDFEGEIATEADAVNGQVYKGPVAEHYASEAIKAMDSPEEYKAVKLKGSGGSLTALPIIETLLGDVSAYIPTNVISITDGQIYLEGDLFFAGIRPAVNAGLSVSRVGGDAQTRTMRQVAGGLRLDMAAFRELAAFAQFGSSLDKATQDQLNRGQRLQEILKQPQYQPVSLAHEVLGIYAGTNGHIDKVEIERVSEWETAMLRFMETSHPEIIKMVTKGHKLSDEEKAKINSAMDAFNASWA